MSIGSALGGGDPHYQAMLVVGDDIHLGQGWLSLSGSDSGVFGASPGGREGAAVAEWLDVAVTGPDGVTRTARRPIFDLVDADARAAGSVDVKAIPAPDLVTLGSDATDEFLPLRDIWALSVATGATSIDGLATSDDTELDEVSSTALSAPLYHVARDGANAALGLDRRRPDLPRRAQRDLISARGDAQGGRNVRCRGPPSTCSTGASARSPSRTWPPAPQGPSSRAS